MRALLVLLALDNGAAQAAQDPRALGLRFGENGTVTRIVVDFDRKVSFAARFEPNPDRLMIDLSPVDWQLAANAGQPLHGLTRGFELGTSAKRSQLAVELAGPVRIANALLLPPSKDSAFHRLVVDLVADAGAGHAGIATAAPMPPPPIRPAAGPPAALVTRQAPVPASRPLALAAVPSVGAAVNGHGKAATRQRERPVIVLDPGHGGIDPGAISADGLREKDLVLEMARELRTLIERSGRYRVVLTRDDDGFIRLRDRIAKARLLGGQVFISLHADSLRMTELRGASIYTLSEQASDEEAAKFAALENKADVLTGANLSQHDAVVATILIDLAQRDTNNKSIAFADILAEELAGVTSLVKRHRRFAGFAVLKSPDVPSVLLELGYLSNPDDARNLAQPDYRAKLGHAIVRALDQYFAVPRT
jgi:N-acetylmuramoyl-L-alanine amidase